MPIRVFLKWSLLVSSILLFSADGSVAQQSPVLTANTTKSDSVSVSSTTSNRSEKILTTEINHFHKVTATLYRGGQPSEKGFHELKTLGIKHIINLRADSNKTNTPSDEAFTLQHIPVSANPFKNPKEADVVQFLKTVTTSSNQPVFVHCQEGVDRTGLMIAAYRIVIDGWSKDEAITEMHEAGSHWFFKRFESYLRKLDVEKIKKQISQ